MKPNFVQGVVGSALIVQTFSFGGKLLGTMITRRG